MRVPNAGQDLTERRIVREAKQLAERLLADFPEPKGLTFWQVYRDHGLALVSALRGMTVRS
ncbi:hypothetical protein [Devosia sp. XK-2]|uniref:hypothetical protein n=1 Tax=Devosia sp. XK-2 TaxID=3126689 RepID=UPI0030D491B8